MLRSDLCDFSDVYIVVKGTITLTKTHDRRFIDIRNRFFQHLETTHHLLIAYRRSIMY